MSGEPPVIIIGAARSGTNALRDALGRLPQFHTWPCDEINYIWLHGNRESPTDELDAALATVKVRRFITGEFDKQARQRSDARLVEKTCANTLRVDFVRAVFPEARFVSIERDPRDVVSSAMQRWTASLDLSYVLAKARFVPKSDLPFYALRYVQSHIHRLSSGEGRLSTWGPRFDGLQDLVRNETPLHEICAYQWLASSQAAAKGLATVPTDQVVRIVYEEFATDPVGVLSRIGAEIGIKLSDRDLAEATQGIHAKSVGAWERRLDTNQVRRVEEICGVP